MHCVTILLWFLCVVLEPSLSIFIYAPRALKRPDNSKSVCVDEYYDYEDDKSWAYVGERTNTSISIHIKLDKGAIYKLLGTEVHYRPSPIVIEPHSLKWNQSLDCYVASDSQVIRYYGEVGHSNFRQSELPSTEEKILISNLRFPGIRYKFDMKYFLEEKYRKTEEIVASTLPVRPLNPPKTGPGCFNVYNVNSMRRDVKVYWQHVEDSYGYMEFEVTVYETDDFDPLFEFRGPLTAGFIRLNINLRHHFFYFRTCNEVGCSERSSTVDVPDQGSILPALNTRVFKSKRENMYVLTWRLAQDVDVTDYTLFWYDRLDGSGRVVFVQDFVFLEKNTSKLVKIKGEDWGGLAISVNTVVRSTGLQPVQYEELDLYMFV